MQWNWSDEKKSRYEMEIQHGQAQRNNESLGINTLREFTFLERR